MDEVFNICGTQLRQIFFYKICEIKFYKIHDKAKYIEICQTYGFCYERPFNGLEHDNVKCFKKSDVYNSILKTLSKVCGTCF